MNFMFEWQELYLTSERSERLRYSYCHIFRTFPKILRKLPKIAEDERRRSEDVSIMHQQILV